MKKILLGSALTALLCNANAEVDQSLTGLHVGLGINVLFDEYSADVDVADSYYHADGDNSADIYTDWQIPTQGDEGPYTLGEQYNSAEELNAVANIIMDAIANHEDNFYVGNDTTPYSYDAYDTNGTFVGVLVKRSNFKRRATNVGGEVKLAYFHDFGNKFMIGVDLSGTIVSKTKKHVKASPFAPTANRDYIHYAGDENLSSNTPFPSVTDEPNPTYSFSLAQASTEDISAYEQVSLSNNSDFINKSFLRASDSAEVAFEKDAFIPRLAFVLGGTYLGWFAGVRLGMAYMTGKVTATDINGSHSKSVSISSPFIGLHLMKQMNIKGINNGHVYVTADWHVGDGHRAVNINGIKSFKQNAFNLAAGLTWRCKLGR